MKTANVITLSDLRSGARPIISERELSQFRGCSVATLQRERTLKKGLPYAKDPRTGRVFYRAEVVLAYFDNLVDCKSTLDYDTTKKQCNLEKARRKASGGAA
jgi:hypothetical protein